MQEGSLGQTEKPTAKKVSPDLTKPAPVILGSPFNKLKHIDFKKIMGGIKNRLAKNEKPKHQDRLNNQEVVRDRLRKQAQAFNELHHKSVWSDSEQNELFGLGTPGQLGVACHARKAIENGVTYFYVSPNYVVIKKLQEGDNVVLGSAKFRDCVGMAIIGKDPDGSIILVLMHSPTDWIWGSGKGIFSKNAQTFIETLKSRGIADMRAYVQGFRDSVYSDEGELPTDYLGKLGVAVEGVDFKEDGDGFISESNMIVTAQGVCVSGYSEPKGSFVTRIPHIWGTAQAPQVPTGETQVSRL